MMRFDKADKCLVVFAAAIVLLAVFLCLVRNPLPETSPPPPAIEAPVPGEPMTVPFFNYLVKVTAHNPGDSHAGIGTLVTYDGYTFVLTSKMIFTEGDTHYTVTSAGEQYSAITIGRSDRLGLVALAVSNGEFNGIPINDAPNVPPDAPVLVWDLEKTYLGQVTRYLTHPDWMLLDGGLPGTCTGSPITTYDNSLAGVVIGVNTENPAEAFAVGNHAINTFAEMVVNPSLKGWKPLIFEPANPNLLFQGH